MTDGTDGTGGVDGTGGIGGVRETRAPRSMTWAGLGGVFLLAGCGGNGSGQTTFETGETAMSASSMTMSGTDADTSGTDSSSSGTTGPSATGNPTDPSTTMTETDPGTDTEPDTDTDDPSGTTSVEPIVPCVGLDVLFVVDNSVGMTAEQSRLQATAFAFVSSIAQGTVSAMGSVQIGVITTDEPELVVPSDVGLYASGLRYMVWDPVSVDANATVQAELGAAVMVGDGGDPNERPMDMLLEALAGDTAEGFNADFVREDALLVVVLVSDEEDDIEKTTLWGSSGDPDEWVDQLASIKDGIRKDIAVFSMIPSMSACELEADDDAPRLGEFTTSFPTHGVLDVCQPDYSAFLLGQSTNVNDACNNFSPP